MVEYRIITWNCLADIWHGDINPKRLNRVLSSLKELITRYDPDILLLQEVTESSYKLFAEYLASNRTDQGPTYISHIAYHSENLWNEQLRLPYQPNGTCIFVKSMYPVIFGQLALGDGNVASTCLLRDDIYVINVHLNDENPGHLREQQINRAIFSSISSRGRVTIIGGDFNGGQDEDAHHRLRAYGFGTSSNPIECDIDYIYVKSSLDFLAMQMPITLAWTDLSKVKNIEERIKLIGSDHYPVGMVLIM
jgi:endonuclease/exonuclease/phosphatase family metal-dependent hydrolase